jgi:hypothetical protein
VQTRLAANERCKGCGGRRVFEIMDKIWRCGRHPLQRVEFEGNEKLEAGDGFLHT